MNGFYPINDLIAKLDIEEAKQDMTLMKAREQARKRLELNL